MRSKPRAPLALVAALTIGTAACAFTPPERTTVLARPGTQPVRTLTSFSASLRCMDGLLAKFGRANYLITAQDLPDATGEVKAGTKEMLISSISAMSAESNAFTFIDFEAQGDVFALGSFLAQPGGPPVPAGFEVPRYYVRGAITQLDSGVVSDSASGAVGVGGVDAGAATDQVMSVVAVDLNIGEVLSRRMLPGVTANNSVVVRRSGRAVDAGASIEALGVNFNLNLNKSEGMHQAVRTLVELSTIEVLGKLVQVPYWRCLEIEQTNPEIEAIARKWFDDMSERERGRFVQRALAAGGFYEGPVNGVVDTPTREAIGAYESSRGLLADGRIDFDLYASLIDGDLAAGREPARSKAPERLSVRASPATAPIALALTTSRSPRHRYAAGEPFTLSLRANREAFVYCYYRDAAGTIVRIFPNRFQNDAYLPARMTLSIPGKAPFSLVPERPASREDILCLAAGSELGTRLPSTLKLQDLAPLPVQELDDIVLAFRRAGAKDLASTKLTVEVAP